MLNATAKKNYKYICCTLQSEQWCHPDGLETFQSEESPGSLQHHDGVLALVRAGRGELHVNVWQGAASGVTVAAARHAAHFDAGVGFPRGESLQPRREGMELQVRGQKKEISLQKSLL